MKELERFQIRTFAADDAEAVDRVVAHVWERASRRLLPATVFAETHEDAKNRLTAFLASEIARERRLADLAAERSERMKGGKPKKGVAA